MDITNRLLLPVAHIQPFITFQARTVIKTFYMSQIYLNDKLIVGVDIHKQQHTAAALVPLVGQVGCITFNNDETGINHLITQINTLSEQYNREAIFALEDINSYGLLLAKSLHIQKRVVLYVTSTTTAFMRRAYPQLNKTDEIDALMIAQATLLKAGENRVVCFDSTLIDSINLKSLTNRRKDLAFETTKYKNSLHKILYSLYGRSYGSKVKWSDKFCIKALDNWITLLLENSNLQSQSAILQIQRLQLIHKEIKLVEKSLIEQTINNPYIQSLAKINGCSQLLACSIMAEIKDINRFANENQLAKFAGIAPTSFSSAGKVKFYLNRRGNRELNFLIYRIALTNTSSISCTAESKAYYLKKIAEGKSKMHALRCLKRQIIRRVFHTLKSVDSYKILA